MRTTLPKLYDKVRSGERLAALTAYDATFASVMDAAGIDCLLVGDSLGMVCQGEETTLSVSLEAMEYHTRSVVKGSHQAFIVADLPFGTYQESVAQAIASSVRLMAAGAQMVKLEGGRWLEETVYALTQRGIPVMAHLGLTPQFIHQLGGYKVQGRSEEDAAQLLESARCLEAAGAQAMVLECIPASLAQQVTTARSIPTIGIGAGLHCSGQILVLHDVLGLYLRKPARFVKDFLQENQSIEEAFRAYSRAVKLKQFPTKDHSFE
jgi:3-methyl-2-oxobutanoate hydroxymethyltransferase